jgi:polar amino acid transport system substrate-binding protein
MKAIVLLALSILLSTSYAETLHAVTETTLYSYIKEGQVAGSATELLKLSLQRAGLTDYSIHLYPWARSYEMAQNRANVLIYPIARTPSREKQFKWIGEFIKTQYHFYKLKARKEIIVKNLSDAQNYTIGVIRDDVRHDYLLQQNFTRLTISAQREDNFKQLINKQIDIIPLIDKDAEALCQQMAFDCTKLEKIYTLSGISNGLHFALSKTTPDQLVEKIRHAFEQLKAEGLVKKIIEKNE